MAAILPDRVRSIIVIDRKQGPLAPVKKNRLRLRE